MPTSSINQMITFKSYFRDGSVLVAWSNFGYRAITRSFPQKTNSGETQSLPYSYDKVHLQWWRPGFNWTLAHDCDLDLQRFYGEKCDDCLTYQELFLVDYFYGIIMGMIRKSLWIVGEPEVFYPSMLFLLLFQFLLLFIRVDSTEAVSYLCRFL